MIIAILAEGVREIVEQHGGKVTADSAGDGLGAAFTIYLPFSQTRSQAPLRNICQCRAELDLTS
jgi:hypothetical protein